MVDREGERKEREGKGDRGQIQRGKGIEGLGEMGRE